MRNKFISRRLFIFWGILLSCYFTGHSQESIAKKYLDRAGDHAIAYSGEIGTIYNPYFFSNTPYYSSPEYATGVIYFRRTCYPNQQIKIDLYRDQLILLSPKLHHGIIVDPRTIKSVQVHGKEFIWHTPSTQSGLATGYYIRLAHGKEAQLLCRYNFQLHSPTDKTQSNFSDSQRYYILYNDIHYPVKNRRSFNKIFPALKKQMKAFEKATKHEYTETTDRALKKEQRLIRLAIFCDQLLSKQTKP